MGTYYPHLRAAAPRFAILFLQGLQGHFVRGGTGEQQSQAPPCLSRMAPPWLFHSQWHHGNSSPRPRAVQKETHFTHLSIITILTGVREVTWLTGESWRERGSRRIRAWRGNTGSHYQACDRWRKEETKTRVKLYIHCTGSVAELIIMKKALNRIILILTAAGWELSVIVAGLTLCGLMLPCVWSSGEIQ